MGTLVPTPPDDEPGAPLDPRPPRRGAAAAGEAARLLVAAAATWAAVVGATRFARAVAEDVGMGAATARLEAFPLLLVGLAAGVLLRVRADLDARLRAGGAVLVGAAAAVASDGGDPVAVARRLALVLLPASLFAFGRRALGRRR